MLRLLINLAIFMMVLRILRPLFRGAGNLFKSNTEPKPAPTGKSSKNGPDYSDLSPYEIEDADFEEVSSKGK